MDGSAFVEATELPKSEPTVILHQPFWCEENIWHLAQHPCLGEGERWVVVLTGQEEEVVCWQQRAADEGAPVMWDYHVVLVNKHQGCQIWDLDTRLGAPIAAHDWLQGTFPCPTLVRRAFQPRFAVLPAKDYVEQFGSDRAHMRTVDGGWLHPPPLWTAISGQNLTLNQAVKRARGGLDLQAFEAFLRTS